MVDYQCRLKCGYAGASAGKTKLALLAQETMASWRAQAERAEMADHVEFLELYDGHVEVFTSKL